MMIKPEVVIERNSDVPLHAQITEPIRQKITEGKFLPGQRFEDEITMAKRLGVSRPTVRHAFQTLVELGLVVRRRSAGTIVAPREIHRSPVLTSLYDDLVESGHSPSTKLISYEYLHADDDIADKLGINRGDLVVKAVRLRLSDNEPLAILKNYFPDEVAPAKDDLMRGGLYRTLGEMGVEVTSAHQTVSARKASTEETDLLQEKRGAPVLLVQRIAFDKNGRIVECGDHIYRAHNYSVSFVLTAT
ncbi:MAG: GntR family transcriptional regulator [Actinomycetaceae bacterium]|nr:GntR family transcriptional regulator [Actinomycetaceae bacterium]